MRTMRNIVDRGQRKRRLLTVTMVSAVVLSPIRFGFPHRTSVTEFVASGAADSRPVRIQVSNADDEVSVRQHRQDNQPALVNRVETLIDAAHAMDKRDI